MFKKYLSSLCLFSMFIISNTSQAATVGYFEYGSHGGSRVISNQINHQLSFNNTVVFDLVLTEADVGTTYILNYGTAFDDAVSLLTNGIDNRINSGITHEDGSGSTSSTNQSDWFIGEWDFSGYDIDNLTLTVLDLRFDIPGRDLNGDGLWTDMDFVARFEVNTVPVPAAVWLFGSGLIGLICIARQRKNLSVDN